MQDFRRKNWQRKRLAWNERWEDKILDEKKLFAIKMPNIAVKHFLVDRLDIQ